MPEPPKDIINVEIPTIQDNILKELREIESKYHKENKPFDLAGAIYDFQDYCAEYETKKARENSRNPKNPEIPPFKTEWNWNEYGKPNRFKLIGEEIGHSSMKGVMAGVKVLTKTYIRELGPNKGGKITFQKIISEEEATKWLQNHKE